MEDVSHLWYVSDPFCLSLYATLHIRVTFYLVRRDIVTLNGM